MRRRGSNLTLVVLAGLLGAFPGPAQQPVAPCGEDLQPPCVNRDIYATGYNCGPSGWCTGWVDEPFCKNEGATVASDGLCHQYDPPAGLDCCHPVSYLDGGYPVTAGKIAYVDLTKAWVVVPNLQIPTVCNSNVTYHNFVASVAPNPRFTLLPSWHGFPQYTTRLKVNANFYDVSDQLHPYTSSCTNGLGLTISNKVVVSPRGQVHRRDTQTLMFYTKEYARYAGHEADIVEDPTPWMGHIQNAVSGFQLLKGGQYVPQPPEITPECWRPRTVVGLTQDRNHLILVVVNPGRDDYRKDDPMCRPAGGASLTMEGLAGYLKTLGAFDALTLDGSGSAQLYYSDGLAVDQTLPSDTVDWIPRQRLYRPVPIFLGFR